ncbi:MAG: hypothetical protein ACK55Z_16480 [bacterium]
MPLDNYSDVSQGLDRNQDAAQQENIHRVCRTVSLSQKIQVLAYYCQRRNIFYNLAHLSDLLLRILP